jgi:hypothetical protein
VILSAFSHHIANAQTVDVDDQVAMFLSRPSVDLNLDYSIQIGTSSIIELEDLPEYPVLPRSQVYVSYSITYDARLEPYLSSEPAVTYVVFFESESAAEKAFQSIGKNTPDDAVVQEDSIDILGSEFEVYVETFTSHPLPVDFTKLNTTAFALLDNMIIVTAVEWNWIEQPSASILGQAQKVNSAVLATNLIFVTQVLELS